MNDELMAMLGRRLVGTPRCRPNAKGMGATAPMPPMVCGQRRRCAVAQGRGMLQTVLLTATTDAGEWRRDVTPARPEPAASGGSIELTMRLSARREAPPTNKQNNGVVRRERLTLRRN